MIYTVTPNPALDLGGIVDEIIPDEKNYVYNETRNPGGNGINVARMVTSLEVPALATGFLGGATGSEIRSLLSQEKVRHRFVEVQGHTRTSVTVSNQKTHRQTRLSFPGPVIQKNEIDALFHLIQEAEKPSILVIGGSLPPGFSEDHLLQLIQLGKSKSFFVAVDVPGKYLKKAVLAKPSMIKPNLSEFQDLIGEKATSKEDVLRVSRTLLDLVPMICVSSVEQGAVLVTKDGSWYGRGPRVEVKSSVGAGDSMVAAMCVQVWKSRDQISKFDEVLRWGIAAAMATISTPGTQLGSCSEIKALYPQVVVESI